MRSVDAGDRAVMALHGVRYRYHRTGPWVLDGLDLELDRRPTVLIGPNGAGKSTLLRLLTGQLPPVGGRVTASASVGFAPQHPVALPSFTVAEQVRYAAWLAGAHRGRAPDLAARALARAGLTSFAARRSTELSGGETARLGIACALAAAPDHLVLDEPTAALDPLARRDVTAVLAGLADEGVGLVATSHTASDVGPPFARLVVLDAGEIRFDGTVEAFLRDDHRDPLVADLSGVLRGR